jgi:hypothetical protein
LAGQATIATHVATGHDRREYCHHYRHQLCREGSEIGMRRREFLALTASTLIAGASAWELGYGDAYVPSRFDLGSCRHAAVDC